MIREAKKNGKTLYCN